MNIFVQKFGGTSTRSRESRSNMYNNIIREVNNGNKVVAVVSAMDAMMTLMQRIHYYQLLIQNN